MKNSFIYKFIVSGLAILALVVSVLTHVLPSYAADSYSYTFNARATHYNGSEEVTYSYVGTFTSDYPICLLQSYSSDYVRYFLVSTTDNTGVTAVIDYADSLGNSNHRTYGYTIGSEINSEYGMIYYHSTSSFGANCSLGYSFNGYNNLKCFTSFDACANYLYNGVTDGDVSGGVVEEDSSEVPVPQGNLYLNSTSTSTTDDRYYQGIELTNYDTSYEVVMKTRYTIPTYATLKFISTYKGAFSVLSQYTSDVFSDDGITFADASSAYFNFYDQLQTSYYDQFWDSSSSDYLGESVDFVVYRQDGTVGSSAMGYNQFVGLDDPGQNATSIKNVSSQFVGKEVWLAYKTLDSNGNIVISEYAKFIVYPLTSCSYNRISGYYTWDSTNIVSGVSYEAVSSGSVGSESIYETPAEESNASGSSNLYNTDSESVSVDVNNVVDGMTSLTSLMGSVPGWFAYIFGFLPTWLITLISIGIAWAIIVGMIKLLKW